MVDCSDGMTVLLMADLTAELKVFSVVEMMVVEKVVLTEFSQVATMVVGWAKNSAVW